VLETNKMKQYQQPRCEFLPYEAEDLEKDIGVEDEARRAAAQNLPRPESRNFSQTEENSNQAIRQHYSSQIASIAPVIEEYSSSLALARSERTEGSLTTVVQEFETELSVKGPIIEQEINQIEEEIDQAKQAKRVFMMDNLLTREPEIKSQTHKLLGFLTIAVLVVLESYINGRIMGPVLPGGELEGRGYAITIAVINVLGSFGAGLFILRYFNHAKKKLRYWSYLGMFLYFLAILYVNLAAGVFRGLAEKAMASFNSAILNTSLLSAEEAAAEAFWPLDNLEALTFQSQLFIGMGIIFAILSLLDGYFIEDPYPKYGKIGKAHFDKSSKLIKRKKDAIVEYNDLKTIYDEKASELRNTRLRGVERWQGVVDALQQSVHNFRAWVTDLEDSANHAIICFQEKNMDYRSDGMVPLYFGSSLDSTSVKVFSFSENQKNESLIFSEVWSDYMDDHEKEEKMENWKTSIADEDSETKKKIIAVHTQYIDELRGIIV